ncbi:MAG: hypothetical protein NTY09_01270, partial [bacterium]|nr:hypothetical protein [bacterium]
MNGRIEQKIKSQGKEEISLFDAALVRFVKLIGAVLIGLMFLPSFLNAQDGAVPGSEGSGGSIGQADLSGAEVEGAVQPSGGGSEAVDLSGGDESELFTLPDINDISGGEVAESEISGGEGERTIFNARPSDPFYDEVVSTASNPDILQLGPLPQIMEEGVEFTDVAGDWIYYQKSAGLTEIRGHCMVIYDTTIISSDEAVLDEKNEIYRFFGEGRVFVDDSDFTLECDEMEIHDAEGEKIIYIKGQSTLVVYADTDAEQPAEDAPRRDKIKYALKQQDTIITFTDAEYDYENDIFDAHNGVKFEQSDKYAQGTEFHGENETEYAHFTGNCEFWQQDGLWLYEYGIMKDKEDPPSRGDKITRALLSVPTTVTCDEMETNTKIGWLQMRSEGENVVYFKQDDKHAECDYFTLFFTNDEEENKEEEATTTEVPRNLLEEPVVPPEEPEENLDWVQPPGYGSLRLASEFPAGYVPWGQGSAETAEEAVLPIISDIGIAQWAQPCVREEAATESPPEDSPTSGVDTELYGMSEEAGANAEDYLSGLTGTNSDLLNGGTSGDQGTGGPLINNPSNPQTPSIPDEAPPAETVNESTAQPEHDSMGFLMQRDDAEIELVTEGIPEDYAGGRDEIFMHGNVFIRQENGNWLFDYDIVNEEDETEENIE